MTVARVRTGGKVPRKAPSVTRGTLPPAGVPSSEEAPAPVAKRPPSRAAAARRANAGMVFRAMITEHGPTGRWPHLFLPADASAFLGRRGAVNVIVTINGVGFRRVATPDGEGGHFIRVNAVMRERAGVEPGERVDVGMSVDHAPPGLELPRDFDQMIRADARARAAYDAMPPSHRKAYLKFVDEAKRPETRARRMQQALRMMTQWSAERSAGKRGRG